MSHETLRTRNYKLYSLITGQEGLKKVFLKPDLTLIIDPLSLLYWPQGKKCHIKLDLIAFLCKIQD